MVDGGIEANETDDLVLRAADGYFRWTVQDLREVLERIIALRWEVVGLTASIMQAVHRGEIREGVIRRLPEVTGDKEPKRKFKAYPIGYFHIDIAEVQTAEGRLRPFVAIDRTSKFAFVELHQ